MFAPIAGTIAQLFPNFSSNNVKNIPNCEYLNNSFNQINHNGKKLVFVKQDDTMPYPQMSYEERIYTHGLIATRTHNWHDFFNAVIWLNFPQIKSAINAIHHQEISRQKDSLRSRKRDLLTLFDESGVVIVAEDAIIKLIKNHQWHELFVENKAQWLNGEIQCISFGHAMYEKYLNPYIGMTAQCLLVEKLAGFSDGGLAENLLKGTQLNSKADLSPLPMLGIPHWVDNQDSAFYQNKNYFR